MSTAGKLIREILLNSQKGKTEEYDLLLNRLIDPATPSKTLKNYLRGLTDCMSVISKNTESLITVIMKMDWLNKDEDVIKAYQNLLVNLMSANTNYSHVGLNMLVKQFLPDKNGLPMVDKQLKVDVELRRKHEQQFIYIHTALSDTCQLIPLTPVLLMPVLVKLFPFYKVDTYIQSCYIKNLLQITQYIPDMRQEILQLIISKLMKLDVLSPRHDLSDIVDSEDEELFEMEEDGEKGEEINELVKEKEIKHKEADCLDILMEMLLNYIFKTLHPNGIFDLESSKKLYWELMNVFEKIILPTYECSHIQFIMFYLVSFKPILADGMLDYLWKIVQNPNTPIIFRQSAVSYMSSLLSRALYIPILTVISCLDLMVAWLHCYLDNLSEDKHPDNILHGTFYAVSQAVFYVFCFRNTELFQSKKGYKWAEALNFQRIVTCRLNPLRHCLPIVVSTFSSYSRRHQLAFCDTIIQRNNRCMIPVVNSATGLAETNFMLKLASFFPFDPFLLPRCGKLINPIYRVYQGEVSDDTHDSGVSDTGVSINSLLSQ
ncbi:hypothetical protein LOTGIDRAFT_212940 [Lottia gigantea]|uniref:RNA polymerase I-specific transcription initiation factor RRN3 n=1 Tax=Lottia gigantea TaxID=225164 RepID=V4ABV0_LOTGI|nr:hypothetical protein LOTGIDRAFT_212940 [Lottia gigantea]ESP01454.1 hypothetical protein LOTGIDRAFT_212940 [Lottia gigantea]